MAARVMTHIERMTHKIVTQFGAYLARPLGTDWQWWQATRLDLTEGVYHPALPTDFSHCPHVIIECENAIECEGNTQA